MAVSQRTRHGAVSHERVSVAISSPERRAVVAYAQARPMGETPMLASNARTMTEFDLRRLDALFERIRDQVRPPSTLSVLERELAQAVVVSPERVPANVVTMNSEVEVLDLETEERRSLTVVFPSMAGIESSRVSVLAPLGTALIGSCEGARIAWHTPRGPRRLQVQRVVYQPEASGRFDL